MSVTFRFTRPVTPLRFATLTVFALIGLVFSGATQATAREEARPRSLPQKPLHATVPAGFDERRIEVKFVDEVKALPNGAAAPTLSRPFGRVSAAAEATLNNLTASGGIWYRVSALNDSTMDRLRQNAEQNLGRRIANLNNYYYLIVPSGASAPGWMDQLNSLNEIEIATPAALPAPAPVTDFQPDQDYFEAATAGVDVFANQNEPGGDGWPNSGARIKVFDFEYSVNTSHADLPQITTIVAPGLTPSDPFNDLNHGTAVFGILGSLNNGSGTTGGAYNAKFYFAPVYFDEIFWSLTTALTTALDSSSAGDFWLIEQQVAGPNVGGGGQQGLVPTEWLSSVYNTYLVAIGNGIHVMEASGNGGEDLDDPVYNTGHAPFLPGNDNGAVIISAGGSPFGGDRALLSFSNYGSRVNVQGWGENIVSTGYGDLYSAEGANVYYTSDFGGSSGASPITTSAGVVISGIYTQQTGGALMTPDQLRSLLMTTGSPQLPPGAVEHIGPRPDVEAALLTFAARFSADTTFGKPPLMVNFNSVVPSATTGRAWDLSEGDMSSGASASHLYTTPGSHTVSLTIQTPDGAFTSTRTALVNLFDDTLRSVDAQANAGTSVRIDFYAHNYLPLTHLVIPFAWGGPLNLVYDSIVTTGLRTEAIPGGDKGFSSIDPFNRKAVYEIDANSAPLAPDTGAVASLYLSIPPGASGSNNIEVTTIFGKQPQFFSLYGSYIPTFSSSVVETGCCVTPGDANGDGVFNISDVTFGIARIFSNGSAPGCQDEADANGDNSFNIADVTFGIARIFSSGPAPACGTTGT